MRKIQKLTSVFLAAIMVLGVLTVAPFTASAASYKDEFINALMNNQSSWNTPLFGYGKSMTDAVYFMDINFDGNLELISKYFPGSGGAYVEIYGYKNNQIIHYNIDKNANLVNIFNCYYDTVDKKYRIFGTDTTKFCFNNSTSHKDKSNYELVVIGNTIYKDFYTCSCPISGYYNLYRKASPVDGYIEGEYNYNITGPNKGSNSYNSRNSERLKNCKKVDVKTVYVGSSDWKNYSYSQKKKALEDSYNAFSYTKYGATSVKLNRSTLTLGVGEKYGLIKTVSPSSANQTCTWSSSNSSIASVDSNGKVTAKKSGWANITVKTSNGKTATCKVTVKPAPTSVKVNPASLTLGKGETYTISESTNSGSYAWGFSWSSSNTSVATVKKGTANKATVTAKGVGTATITIKTYNGKTATCKVTVKPAPTSIKSYPASVTIGKGESYTLAAGTNSGSWSTNFTWSSGNTNVATVTGTAANKAKITAKGTGTAIITIKTFNGKTTTCKVTVKPAPTSVKANVSSLTLGKGETSTISAITSNGSWSTNFTWSSNNTNIATVTGITANKAKITAKNTGTATITIKTFNGKTTTCKVTVKPAPTSVKANVSSLTLGKGETSTISAITSSGSWSTNFTWSSSNTNVATVTGTTANKAKITAKGTGTTIITLKTYNGKTATFKVTVINATRINLGVYSFNLPSNMTYEKGSNNVVIYDKYNYNYKTGANYHFGRVINIRKCTSKTTYTDILNNMPSVGLGYHNGAYYIAIYPTDVPYYYDGPEIYRQKYMESYALKEYVVSSIKFNS